VKRRDAVENAAARAPRGAWPWLAVALALGQPAAGQHALSAYGGLQSGASSDVSGRDVDGTGFDFSADWEANPLDPAYYYGLRYAYWRDDGWGGYADFTHAKLYADAATLARSGFGLLEFTDGLNVMTFGVQRRFTPRAGLIPYIGVGVGFAYPHVETRSPAADARTFGYQFGGPAVEIHAGASHAISERWAVFGEYQGTYVWLDVDMDGGGSLETQLATNALNLGLSFAFP
jgi:lipid A oxidase